MPVKTSILTLLVLLTTSPACAQLNDTGILFSGQFPKSNHSGCEDTRQDCGTGTNSFDYTKIDMEGNALAANATSWACVLDNVSGLMWQAHSSQDRFTWYNSIRTQNGGDIGDWNKSGATCKGYQPGKPRTYCHAEQYASRTNKQTLCGYDDWRVPTKNELSSIVHFGRFQPAINIKYFPNTSSNFYWTNDPVPSRPIEAWSIDFEFGTTSPLRKTDLRPVRLVRKHKTTALKVPSLTKSVSAQSTQQICQPENIQQSAGDILFDDESVTDNRTGLVWQRCLVGQSGKNCEQGNVVRLDWQQALSHAAATEGWRLPNIRELASLSETSCIRPAIDSQLFPTSIREQIWSSSPYHFYDHYSWYWDAEDGIFIYGERADKRAVRLVR